MLLAATSLPAGEATVSKEYQIKAAYLYNFVKYVDWPAERFGGDSTPLVIGLFGHNPFGAELDRILQGRLAGTHVITTRVVTSLEQSRTVHLLFIPAGEESLFADATGQLHENAVVTVGESDRFRAHGGMITFMREADKIRFAVNLAAAEVARVKFSAQLLKLASEIQRKP